MSSQDFQTITSLYRDIGPVCQETLCKEIIDLVPWDLQRTDSSTGTIFLSILPEVAVSIIPNDFSCKVRLYVGYGGENPIKKPSKDELFAFLSGLVIGVNSLKSCVA